MDDTSKVKQILNSEYEGVRRRGRPPSRWLECVWIDIKKGRITNWRGKSRNRNEWRMLLRRRISTWKCVPNK
jgi:hypothetical protein